MPLATTTISVTTQRSGNPVKCLAQVTTSELASLSSYDPFNAERQEWKLWIPTF